MTEETTTDHGPLGYCCDCIVDDVSPPKKAATLREGTALCGQHVKKREASQAELIRQARGGR